MYDQIMSNTAFLPESAKMKERIYCILYDISSPVLCVQCNTMPVSYDYKGKTNAGYKKYCSSKCIANSDTIKSKKESTNIERYGASNTFQSEEIKKRIRQTNLDRYGVESVLSLDENRKKAKEKMLEKYGTEHYLQSETGQQHHVAVMLERFGVERAAQSEEIKEKMKATSMERFGGVVHAQKHIPRYVMDRLTNKEWIEEQHYNKKKTFKRISTDLGVGDCTVGNYARINGVKVKTFAFSQAEKEIVDFIKDHYTGLVLENDRTIIKPKELDIVLPELKIAIEYCGLYWHSSDRIDKRYHYDKMVACNKEGYRLITIFEDEWIYSKDIMKSKLLHIIGMNDQQTVYARKTKVESISISERKEILDTYHIQGNGGGSITYGLYYEDTLVSVMTFKRRSEGVYELNRFASSCSVVGGFSKLLSHFKKSNEWTEIISFADRRWSEGDVYYKNGFKIIKELSPDYRYVVGDKRVHKFNFRHKNLKTKLLSYDESKTELENTENNNIYRIYDCGLLKFSIYNS
jgi:hypothetical protein